MKRAEMAQKYVSLTLGMTLGDALQARSCYPGFHRGDVRSSS